MAKIYLINEMKSNPWRVPSVIIGAFLNKENAKEFIRQKEMEHDIQMNQFQHCSNCDSSCCKDRHCYEASDFSFCKNEIQDEVACITGWVIEAVEIHDCKS